MAGTRKKSVLVAFLQALLAWVAFYIVISQVLVIVQWNTIHPEVIKHSVEEIRVEVALEPVVEERVVYVEVQAPGAVMVVLDDETKERNQLLLQQLHAALSQQTSLVSDLKSRIGILEYHNTVKTKYPPPKTNAKNVAVKSLSTLLSQPTLVNTNDEALKQLLTNALKELETAIETNVTIALLKTLLQSEFERVATSPSPSNCPAPPEGARASDLRAYIASIQVMLSEQQSLEQLLEDGNESLEGSLEEFLARPLPPQIDELYEASEPPDVAPVNDDDDRICLLEEDLQEMVNVALLNSPSDLQVALTNFVKELDPKSGLILDALLPPPLSTQTNPTSPTAPTNLRQALNNEWFWYTSTRFVDILVEWTSGYHDGLDGALDKLLLTSGESSVGRIFVSHLLQVAGSIPVPQPVVGICNSTKAGMLATAA